MAKQRSKHIRNIFSAKFVPFSNNTEVCDPVSLIISFFVCVSHHLCLCHSLYLSLSRCFLCLTMSVSLKSFLACLPGNLVFCQRPHLPQPLCLQLPPRLQLPQFHCLPGITRHKYLISMFILFFAPTPIISFIVK